MFIDPVLLRNNPSIVGFKRLGHWLWDPTAPAEFTREQGEAMAGLEALVQTGYLQPILGGETPSDESQSLIVHPRLSSGARFVEDAIKIAANPPVFPPDLGIDNTPPPPTPEPARDLFPIPADASEARTDTPTRKPKRGRGA